MSDPQPPGDEELSFSSLKAGSKKRGRNARKKADQAEADDEPEADLSEAISAAKRIKTKENVVADNVATTKVTGPRTDAAEIVNFAFGSSGSQSLAASDTSVTSTIQTETEKGRDAIGLYEKEQALLEQRQDGDGKDYAGQAGYRQYHKRAAPDRVAGPMRTTASIRVTSRFDYQPDICKDYKETGYCGYGDNCKFMHDRGDYKTGWQIDKEWEEKEKRRAAGIKDEDDAQWEIKEEELPFACLICRKPFVDPVVTRCGHYFCENCALERSKKDKRCFACKEPTLGIFNMATKILQRRAKIEADKKEKEEAEKAEEVQRVRQAAKENAETGEFAPVVV